MCPNEMVPLQIDLAIDAGRYLLVRRANPSHSWFAERAFAGVATSGREPPGRQVKAKISVPVMSASVCEELVLEGEVVHGVVRRLGCRWYQ